MSILRQSFITEPFSSFKTLQKLYFKVFQTVICLPLGRSEMEEVFPSAFVSC